MGTATFRGPLASVAILALAIAGCGSSVAVRAGSTSSDGAGLGLYPARAAPATWHVARIPAGAALYYPPGWQRAGGDPGTATAVLRDGRGRLVGYLNATPRQSTETLGDWARFRVAHNRQEGNRDVTSEAAVGNVAFRGASGTCVRDRYTTTARISYIEVACLVAGKRASSVIVAAASSDRWSELAPLLYRAIAAFST